MLHGSLDGAQRCCAAEMQQQMTEVALEHDVKSHPSLADGTSLRLAVTSPSMVSFSRLSRPDSLIATETSDAGDSRSSHPAVNLDHTQRQQS
jgi:hypothetical protein